MALKPEWSFLKNHFSFEKTQGPFPLYEIKDKKAALLQVGFGPEKSLNTLLQFFSHYNSKAIFHFGTSGALSENCPIETVYTTKAVTKPQEKEFSLMPAKFLQGLINSEYKLLTVDTPLISAKEKTDAFHKFSCETVDMETYDIAKLCYDKQTPYFSVRGIVDGFNENISELIEDDTPNAKTFFQSPIIAKRMQNLQKTFLNCIEKFLETPFSTD